MTDRQILISALKKAFPNKNDIDIALVNAYYDSNPDKIYYADIFSHKFAKAFWGEDMVHKVIDSGGSRSAWNSLFGHELTYEPIWKLRLSQMVLEENPLKYLEKFLDDEAVSR